MSVPFLGQLMPVSFNFAPKGWAQCNGSILAINQNSALFALLGTTYGGNGTQTFALPNLQGRTPISFGNGFSQGQTGGEEFHTLIANEVPTHNHQIVAITTASGDTPLNAYLAGGGAAVFNSFSGGTSMNPATLSNYGGSQPHENRQPFLVMNWVIALSGLFPSRS